MYLSIFFLFKFNIITGLLNLYLCIIIKELIDPQYYKDSN